MGHLVLFKIDQSKRIVISIFMAVGQLTFFSIPVLKTIYSDSYSKIMIPANMMTLSFRLILYIYCYFAISKLKFNKEKIKFTLKSIFKSYHDFYGNWSIYMGYTRNYAKS